MERLWQRGLLLIADICRAMKNCHIPLLARVLLAKSSITTTPIPDPSELIHNWGSLGCRALGHMSGGKFLT